MHGGLYVILIGLLCTVVRLYCSYHIYLSLEYFAYFHLATMLQLQLLSRDTSELLYCTIQQWPVSASSVFQVPISFIPTQPYSSTVEQP